MKKEQFTQITLEDLRGLGTLDRSAILTYLAMRIYGGKDGQTWASQERIGQDTGVSTPSVRRSFSRLRQAGLIVEDPKQSRATSTHIVKDLSALDISDLRPGHIRSEILDISDPISEDLISDIQIDKENIKNIETKNIINKTDLINVTEEDPKEPEEKYSNIMSFEEVHKMSLEFLETKKGTSKEVAIDELDLLFEKLWSRHSVAKGWIAERTPIQDFQKVRVGYTRTQITKGLKSIDYKIKSNQVGSGKWTGLRWIDGMRIWFARQNEVWTEREQKQYIDCIHVSPAEVEQRKCEIIQERESRREERAKNRTDTRARSLWAQMLRKFPDYQDRYNAILKAGIYKDDLLVKQIKEDPELKAFFVIVATHIDLASFGLI
jgi:hypothetical protein